METTLEGAGYAVLSTDTLTETLRLAVTEKPDLVVMDLFLDNESYPERVVEEQCESRGGCTLWPWNLLRKPRVVERRLAYATGSEVIRSMRASPETAATRFILLTNKTARIDWYGCEGVEIDCYLTEPFQPVELLQFVSRVLSL